jgi:hypothetical protein
MRVLARQVLRVRMVLDAISALLLVAALVLMIDRAPHLLGGLAELARSVSFGGLGLLVLCALLYAGGHLLRILRLYLVLGEINLRVANLVRFHLTVSFLGAFLPFRLGDLLRFSELARATGQATASFIVVLIERSLDVAVVLVLVAALWWAGNAGDQIAAIAIATAGFLFAALALFLVGPLALRSLANTALMRGRSWRSLALLQTCEIILRTAAGIPRPDLGRLLALVLVTMAIWVLEFGVFIGAGLAIGAFAEGADLGASIVEVLSAALGSETVTRGATAEAFRLIVVTVLGAGALASALPYFKRRVRGVLADTRTGLTYRIDAIQTRPARRTPSNAWRPR